jgi:hypothetical protein
MSKWMKYLGAWTSHSCFDHFFAVMACLDGVAKEGEPNNVENWAQQCRSAVSLKVLGLAGQA